MSDQTKKWPLDCRWEYDEVGENIVTGDDERVIGEETFKCHLGFENLHEQSRIFNRHIVAIHNAIVRAGIDWRALERSPNALKTMIRLYVSAINQIEGHVSVELDRDLLEALGVKP